MFKHKLKIRIDIKTSANMYISQLRMYYIRGRFWLGAPKRVLATASVSSLLATSDMTLLGSQNKLHVSKKGF